MTFTNRKTVIIIQARKGSSRLPNKMVLPFYKGKGVFELVLEKLIKSEVKALIILATTTNLIDDELVTIASNKKIEVFRGDEQNVLKRFIDAADYFSAENIIRVCADNPFLDVSHIPNLIDEIEKNKYDYISFKHPNGRPTIKTHLGLFTEATTINALKKIRESTSDTLYLEHVTNYLYEQTDNFKLLNLPDYFINTNDIRLTLDTIEDFNFEKKLYEKFSGLNTKELIEMLKSSQEAQTFMHEQIIKNEK
ncbi:MAG: hypothetical protein JXR60_00225 [Bacteroidales bacterium]|nr:hypothetical protein [Bacteroidales bacterium]